MIHAVLICGSLYCCFFIRWLTLPGINTSGVARLTKFYTPQSAQTLIQKIFSLIISRPPALCNFLDAPELEAFLGPKKIAHAKKNTNDSGNGWEEDEKWKVVYRNYATLYFVFVVDGAESELGVLDLIQVGLFECARGFRVDLFRCLLSL